MIKRVFAPLIVSFVVCALALCSFGCASLPRKERALKAYQGTHASIAAVQDAERLLCLPDTSVPTTKCTSKLAPTVGLTDAKHVQINVALVKAFDIEIKAGIALKAWKAGDPAPKEVTEFAAVAQEVLNVAETLTSADSDVRRIVANAREWLNAVQLILDSLKGGV